MDEIWYMEEMERTENAIADFYDIIEESTNKEEIKFCESAIERLEAYHKSLVEEYYDLYC